MIHVAKYVLILCSQRAYLDLMCRSDGTPVKSTVSEPVSGGLADLFQILQILVNIM